MSKTKRKEIGAVAAAALALVAYVGGYVAAERTLLPLWCPAAMALSLSVGSCLLFIRGWQRFTGIESRPTAVLAYLFFVGSLAWFAPLAVNAWPLAGAATYEERVTVVEKEHVTRTKYRRVGRHRRIADGVRHTYYLRVRFADGLEKRYSVSQAEYGRTREHAEKTLVLRRGLLGVPVIRR